eukprot:scaffold879_cov170-Ochromonas_danica.AAC.1
MGIRTSKVKVTDTVSAPVIPIVSPRLSHKDNIHPVNPDIKIHSVVSFDLDYDHDKAMQIPLGEVTDEQLLAEVARRRLDLHDKITDALVKETYDIGKTIGHGASGKVYLVTHKITGQQFACKVVKKNSNMNDAQSMSTEIEIMKRIRHRNIGSGASSEMKIADFGLSALVRIEEGNYDPEESTKRKNFRQLKDMWGTKEYFAPEVIEQSYGPQADVWALGCVLYEMLSGEQAFPVRENDTESKFYGRITRGEYDLNKPVWKKISAEAKDLLQKLLKTDPNQRLCATEALLHPWITGAAHRAEHLNKLEDAQQNMRARLERRARRAQAAAAAAANAHHNNINQ